MQRPQSGDKGDAMKKTTSSKSPFRRRPKPGEKAFGRTGAAILGVLKFKNKTISAVEKKKSEAAVIEIQSVERRLRFSGYAKLKNLSDGALEAHIPVFAKQLWESDYEIRLLAAETLGRFKEQAKPHAAALAERVAFRDETTSQRATETLARMGEPGRDALASLLNDESNEIKELQEALDVDDDVSLNTEKSEEMHEMRHSIEKLKKVRRQIVDALASIGTAAGDHALLVATFLDDEDPRMRLCAIHCLGAFGSAAGDYATTLAKGLNSDDVEVREATAASLGKIGTASLPYAEGLAAKLHPSYFHGGPSLRNVVDDKIVPIPSRMVANASLMLMADAGAAALAEHIEDDDSRVRTVVTEALGQMGDDATPYAAQLASKFVEFDPIIRARAAEALGNLGVGAMLYVDQLAALLWDSDSGVRRAAGEALQQVVEASDMPYEALMDATKRAEAYTRHMGMLGHPHLNAHRTREEYNTTDDRGEDTVRYAYTEEYASPEQLMQQQEHLLGHPLVAPPENRQRIGLHMEYSLDYSAKYQLRVNETPQKGANPFAPVP